MPKPPMMKAQDITQFDTPSPVSMSNSQQEPDTTSPAFSISTTKLSSVSPTFNMSNSLTYPSLAASPTLSSNSIASATVVPSTIMSPSPTILTKASTSLPNNSPSPPSKNTASRQATPKRVSSPMSPSLESATKRRPTWRQEEEEDSDSDGPVGNTLDSTYECIPNLPPTVVPAKEGMNDTMMLVTRLDNAGLDS